MAKSARLPPGLLNHGNTCFMNSVLQGLIATHPLARLVRAPSPGRVGDHLLAVLHTASDIQNTRRRENISPKDLLAELGKKYDQYLDFRQQDAHEFLCHLLDAVRMEELDAIKQRSQDGQPLSFVDVLFGGKLASILVCQACKHVSHTYEDFTDLSLSIKPEDYVRERKRDKLRQFAKKIGTAFYPVPQQRSSSVPTTPIRDANLDSPQPTQRRKSVDLADVDIVVQPAPDAASHAPPSPSPLPDSPLPETPTDPVPVSPHASSAFPEKPNGKESESWTKISRRITSAMRPKADRRRVKKVTPSATPSKPLDDGPATDSPTSQESTPLGLVNDKLQAHLANMKRSVMPTSRSGNSPLGVSAPRFPLISRPSSPGIHPKSSKPRPPKLSAQEAAYLRDILADINPPNIQRPFSIFKQSKDPSFASQNIFLKVNQINRIEECLRLFTAVEVLDGDNTVRCHRCWKIANGYYKPRPSGSAQESDSCTDSEDTKPNGKPPYAIPVASSSPTASTSATSLHDTQISHDTQSTLTQPPSSTLKHVPPALQLNDRYPIDLVSPIKDETPRVSHVSPESLASLQTAKPAPNQSTDRSSRISLTAPSDQHRQCGSRSGDSNTESEISEAESETLLSVYSDASSVASRSASQDRLRQPSSTRHPSGVPRSRQFVSRPAYKRYLVASPPPILVVHLKRFQQLSKTPVVAFSTGFKKLDDYISFPEYLDLAPYLAPRREDYFDSKVAVGRGRARRPAPCMYRLYAVVVHIGNMLGGHYVAYTALPPSPSDPTEGEKQDGETASREWAYVSDTIVRLSSLEEVLKSKAYICMYERI